jgi:Rrf2 family protein
MRLAGNRGKEPLTITDIANGESLSLPHVGKIMGKLKEAGLVASVRGRSGGYVLSVPADELTLSDIFRALDGRILETAYCHKPGSTEEQCVHAEDCSILPLWEALTDRMNQYLKDITLADLKLTEARGGPRKVGGGRSGTC